jgi:hypothetical protein
MKLDADKPLITSPDVVFREEEDGSFLFDPDTGDLKCLNPMGNLIWGLCDGRRTLKGIEAEVISHYPSVPPERIHSDLVSFLEGLLETGYVGQALDDNPSSL